MGDGVYFVDRERRIQFWNRGAERLTGYESAEVLGRCCQEDILCHIDTGGQRLCLDGCPLAACIADGDYHEARVFLRHKEGHRVPVLVRVQPMRDPQGAITGAVEIFSDNSQENESQRRIESLRRLAFLDPLTELPNRRYLEMSLGTARTEFDVHHQPFGVLMFDVDRFKQVNDGHGHGCGDVALREIGRSLQSAVRPTDTLGRWGGDEFLAIVRDVDLGSLTAIANRCATLARRTRVEGAEGAVLALSISAGGVLALPGESAEELVKRADDLLYLSKAAGRDRATVR